jgi:hypothetical protein
MEEAGRVLSLLPNLSPLRRLKAVFRRKHSPLLVLNDEVRQCKHLCALVMKKSGFAARSINQIMS